MDNEVIIVIGEKEFHFRLKSQVVVTLEKVFGKNIFELFKDLSFTSIQRMFWESLVNKTIVSDEFEMMDCLLEKHDLIELGNDLLQELAVKSGILKKEAVEDDEPESIEEIKNA